jgi:hypothetical protein
VEVLLGPARELACERGRARIVIGLNGHLACGVGIQAEGLAEKAGFDSLWNPPWYADYFERRGLESRELVSWASETASLARLFDGPSARRLEGPRASPSSSEPCSFRSIHCMYRGRYQRRDVDELLRDIREVQRLGLRKFLLIDDNIVSEPEYMRELCAEDRVSECLDGPVYRSAPDHKRLPPGPRHSRLRPRIAAPPLAENRLFRAQSFLKPFASPMAFQSCAADYHTDWPCGPRTEAVGVQSACRMRKRKRQINSVMRPS